MHKSIQPLKICCRDSTGRNVHKNSPLTASRPSALPRRRNKFAQCVPNLFSFFSKKYEEAAGAFHDRLHQPYRSSLVPGLDSAIAQAEKAGALGAFLSGAGPTLMAITTKSEETIGQAMVQALRQAGHHSVDLKILSADNSGLRIVKSLP